MTSIADFIKLPKRDFLSSLDFGMRYPSFVLWSGFYLPGFPENGSPADAEMQAQVQEYTSLRIACADDIKKLLLLSVNENLADCVCEAHYSLNFDFFKNCANDSVFYSLLENLVQKYREKSKIILYLPVDVSKLSSMASLSSKIMGKIFPAFETDIFEGVFFYGFDKKTADCIPPEVSEILNLAKSKNLKVKLDAGLSLSADCLLKLLHFFEPHTLINADCGGNSDGMMNFLRQNNIQAAVTPETGFQDKKNSIKEKAQKMRTLLEGGIKTFPATKSILFYNKSISQLACDLCSTGLFTKDEMISVLSQ